MNKGVYIKCMTAMNEIHNTALAEKIESRILEVIWSSD